MVGFPRRRRVVSSTPPPARRVPVVGGDRPPPPTRVRGESFERGRVFALFGGRGVGKSTLVRVANEETVTPTAAVLWDGNPDIADLVAMERRRGAEVIFLDGCPRNVEDVQWLYDERIVAPGFGGAVVRVDRNAVVDPEFGRTLGEVEARILDLSMPYFVVRNDDLERAVVDLLCRAGVTK